MTRRRMSRLLDWEFSEGFLSRSSDGGSSGEMIDLPKVKLNDGDLPVAGQVYQKLKIIGPQSNEIIEARELIKAAVKKGK